MHKDTVTKSIVMPLASGFSICIGSIHSTDPQITLVTVSGPDATIDMALDPTQVADLRFALGEALKQLGMHAN